MVQITTSVREIVRQKLAAFEEMRPEFERCFRFVQEAHGQKRLSSCSIADIVYYLHARWVCDCKGNLLSVPHAPKEWDGKHCLELLRGWQIQGDSAGVITFLQRRLDTLPFADLTRQIDMARARQEKGELVQRLLHGRTVLLNRGFNLLLAVDEICAHSREELLAQVCAACERYGHLPEQITQQLAQLEMPLYAYVPHQELARRNMVLMNMLSQEIQRDVHRVMEAGKKHPDKDSTAEVLEEPLNPLAEFRFPVYQELTSTAHNNIMRHRFYSPMPARR